MKRYFGIMLLVLSLAVTLCACGDSDKAQKDGAVSGSAGSEDMMLSADPVSDGDVSGSSDSENSGDSSGDAANGGSGSDVTGDEPSYYGTWVLKDFQPSEASDPAESAGLPIDKAKTLVGSTVTYQSDAVLQNDRKIELSKPAYKTEAYTSDLFSKNYNINLGDWWNGVMNISLVSANASEEFLGSQFFVVDEDTLWIYNEGIFFMAKRA